MNIPYEPVKFKLTVAQEKAMGVLISDATHIALGGGSRSGKTVLFMRAILMRAMRAPGSRHVVFRFRFNAVKSSVVLDTLPKVLSLCFPELPSVDSMLNKSDWYLTLPNGSEIWFGGLDDKERTEKILGQEYATIFFNECSQIPWTSVVTALTRLAQKTDGLRLKSYSDFNPPSKIHWTYLTFVERKDPITKQVLRDPMNYGFFLINPADNRENLDPGYLAILEALPPKARERFLLGRFADTSEGSLWTVELLATTRILDGRVPDYLRIVVAVDPSGCSGPEDLRSDEIGIVVVALGVDGHGYILEDLSGRYGPAEWGKVAVDALKRHKGDRIVGEINYGGAMVEAVIRAEDPDIPYSSVTASRGKVVRAEPISALYELNKIHHVGYFPEMEDQLTAMTTYGYFGLRSPDRADAAIWGLTELFPGLTKSPESTNWIVPQKRVQSRKASRFDNHRRLG